MIESLGKLLVDPLAERWKSAAVGGSLVLWLYLVGLALFTRDARPGTDTWPVDCRPGRGHSQAAWCALTATNRTAVLVVALVAGILATAFLAQALAPSVLSLLQAESWNNWPVLPVVPRKIQRRFVRTRSQHYPTARFEGGVRPTRVGNRLASLTEVVKEQFGLEMAAVWDVIVAALPEEARAKLVGKSQSIMLACQSLLLGVIAAVAAVLIIPGGWTRLIVPLITLAVAVGLWRAVAGAVDEYCELVITTLVLYHGCLYTALGEAPPGPGEDLQQRGLEVTRKIKDMIGLD